MKEYEKVNRLDKFSNTSENAEEAIKLLQACIRVDTTNPPGKELRLAKDLKKVFDEEKSEIVNTKIIETVPNRGNLIVDLKGSNPENYPTWGFAAHLDVVPAPGEWKHEPFSGDITETENDRYIWGRGAFDMKQIGVAHTIAFLTLLREGFRPMGNIKLIFEADEERGGNEGAKILVEDHYSDVKVDFLITEGGGFKLPTGSDFMIQRGEKGKCQTKLTISGVPGHGSTPPDYEKFAMYKMIKILEKIRERKSGLYLDEVYKKTINSLSIPPIAKFFLKKKQLIKPISKIGSKIIGQDLNRIIIPLITDTISPTIFNCGIKENVISPNAELTLDIRTLPGHDQEFIYDYLKELFGKELFKQLDLEPVDVVAASTSSINTPYYKQIDSVVKEMYPNANLIPVLGTGGTDMKHWRKKGIPCYGFSFMMKGADLSYGDFLGLAHAPNERISLTNLMLGTEFAYRLMRQV
ncbi:MAG: M20/M25/M40 family metallo-hydrolase [Promethearchaeia archaeon]